MTARRTKRQDDVLSLYPGAPELPVETCEPLDRNPACRRCSRASEATAICIPAEIVEARDPSDSKVLHVVASFPTKNEDTRNRPLCGDFGRWLRSTLTELWAGPIIYDNALRCHSDEPSDTQIDACRPYLTAVMAEAVPDRVVTLGTVAAAAIGGRRVFGVQRAYSYLYDPPTPIFMFGLEAARNIYAKRQLAKDLQWACTTNPPQPPWGGNVIVVKDGTVAKIAAATCRAADFAGMDSETWGALHNDDFRVLTVGMAPHINGDARTAFVWDEEGLANDDARAVLVGLLSDPAVRIVTHNWSYDARAVQQGLGAEMRGLLLDTLAARSILEPGARGGLDVANVAAGMSGHKKEAQDALIPAIASVKKRQAAAASSQDSLAFMDEPEPRPGHGAKTYAYGYIPKSTRIRYCGLDTVATSRLGAAIGFRLEGRTEHRVWDELLRDCVLAFTRLEAWGIALDPQAVRNFDKVLDDYRVAAEEKLGRYGFAGNLGSSPDVAKFLYGHLGLPITKYTDGVDANGKRTTPSTDKSALEEIKEQHPAVGVILERRKAATLQSRYSLPILEFLRDDGRIHPSYLLHGASTGRIACVDPNLLNIPKTKDVNPDYARFGKLARSCYVAPHGRILVSADYSQCEPRQAAVLSGDEEMLRIFQEGLDYHQTTAEGIAMPVWGIAPEAVTPNERDVAKRVNLALMYGAGDSKIAELTGLPLAEAVKVRGAVLGKFKKFSQWVDAQVREARTTGEVWTYWKGERFRRRPLWDIASIDKKLKSTAENGASNTPIQGSAADLCLWAVCRLTERIVKEKLPAKLVTTVYDQVLAETDEAFADEMSDIICDTMESAPLEGVPLVVDVEVGYSWGALEEKPRRAA